MLRIVLFLATNLAVLVMAAVAMAALTALGIIPPDAPYVSMLVWCALFGFGGSILSLAMSKTVAKASTRAHVIEAPSNDVERWLVSTVERFHDLDDNALQWRCEQTIRNYDPCISCATHFLKLDVERA